LEKEAAQQSTEGNEEKEGFVAFVAFCKKFAGFAINSCSFVVRF